MANRWMFIPVLWSFALTGCAPAAVNLTPVASQNSASASPKHVMNSYKAPKQVLGMNISGDSPAQPWSFPTDPARVTRQVYQWLHDAKEVSVTPPATTVGVMNGYLGPARLYFTDQNGHHVSVFPAYSLTGNAPIRIHYVANTVEYQDGSTTTYLHAPALYTWLRADKWVSEFQMESYTPAEQRAINTVLHATEGVTFKHGFPNRPAVQVFQIPRGGPDPMNRSNATIPGTTTTQAKPVAANTEVTFTETWNNGQSSHSWTYLVSRKGAILRQSQTGDTAPQDWQ